MDGQLIGLVVVAGVNGLLLAALLWLALRGRRARRDLQALRAEVAGLQRDVQALCTGASALGGHVGRLQHELGRLSERQERLSSQDSGRREYDDAVRLARSGSDVEQLVAKCRLGRAEAELLVGLYGGQRQALN